MKVLLTHERYLPDFGGGGEHVVAQTALQLANRGFDVEVLTTGDPKLTSHEGIPTTRLPISRYRMNLESRTIERMARDADLIHTFSYHACLPSLFAGRALGKPVFCTCLALFGDAWLPMRGKLAGRAFRAWERFLTTRPFTRILFLSEYSRAEGIALGVPPERACVSSPGFYPAHCAPAPARDDVVLFAGKFETRKGVLDVLEVARALPHIPFRMIGWGPEMDFLKRAAPHNLRIGDETGEAYYRILGRARIFLFPSKGETFGISLLEAMASGCAIVSSVPLEFAGFRVNPGDCASMAAAVARLWETPEMWRTHSERNIQLAASYTWDRYAESVMETYAQVLPVPSVSIRARVFSA